MFRGGYKVIDFQDKSITREGVTVTGVYEAIKNSGRYALQICNVTLGGTAYNDTFISIEIDGDDYIFEAYGYKFTITSEDVITLE